MVGGRPKVTKRPYPKSSRLGGESGSQLNRRFPTLRYEDRMHQEPVVWAHGGGLQNDAFDRLSQW